MPRFFSHSSISRIPPLSGLVSAILKQTPTALAIKSDPRAYSALKQHVQTLSETLASYDVNHTEGKAIALDIFEAQKQLQLFQTILHHPSDELGAALSAIAEHTANLEKGIDNGNMQPKR